MVDLLCGLLLLVYGLGAIWLSLGLSTMAYSAKSIADPTIEATAKAQRRELGNAEVLTYVNPVNPLIRQRLVTSFPLQPSFMGFRSTAVMWSGLFFFIDGEIHDPDLAWDPLFRYGGEVWCTVVTWGTYLSFCRLKLLLSHDVELNPGPDVIKGKPGEPGHPIMSPVTSGSDTVVPPQITTAMAATAVNTHTDLSMQTQMDGSAREETCTRDERGTPSNISLSTSSTSMTRNTDTMAGIVSFSASEMTMTSTQTASGACAGVDVNGDSPSLFTPAEGSTCPPHQSEVCSSDEEDETIKPVQDATLQDATLLTDHEQSRDVYVSSFSITLSPASASGQKIETSTVTAQVHAPQGDQSSLLPSGVSQGQIQLIVSPIPNSPYMHITKMSPLREVDIIQCFSIPSALCHRTIWF